MRRLTLLLLAVAVVLAAGALTGVGLYRQHQQALEHQQAVALAQAAKLSQARLAAAAKATRVARGGTTHLQNPAAAAGTAASEGIPLRVLIPRIDVNAALEKLGENSNGSLETPHYADEAGWFTKGVTPGQQGPAIIVGHVDTIQGPAVFANLRQLQVGDRIVVVMSDGKHLTYRVDDSRVVQKALFPSAAVYGPTPDAQLRIITCNEPFDPAAGTYTNNLVLFATLVN